MLQQQHRYDQPILQALAASLDIVPIDIVFRQMGETMFGFLGHTQHKCV